MVACPASSTWTVAWRRDTLSNWAKDAATSDSAGSRPSITDVPAGISTLPVGKVIRMTTGEMRRRRPVGSGVPQVEQTTSAASATEAPQLGQKAPGSDPAAMKRCEMVGVNTSSSGPGWCGRLAPHRKQIRSSGWTLTPQSGQLRLAMFSLSCLGSQPPLDYRRPRLVRSGLYHYGGTTPLAPPPCEGRPMVSYQLAPEQQDLRDSVAQFARDVVAPVIGGYYERGEFPYDIVAKMGKLGLFGLPFPEEYGGMGGDYFALCLALEELARVDSSVAITLEAGVSLGAMPIYRFGTAEQRNRWLPELCTGERLAAFGLTEPGGGSDIPGGMRTTARLEAGQDKAEWVVDGSKSFITNSGTAITSLVTVLAITGHGEDGRKEISSIIVPNGTAGFVPGPEYSKVGWCASDTRELSFTGCRVPEENLLGERGRGYAQFLRILTEGRVAIAALATGLAQGCVDECVRYAGQREAFGRPIGQHQAIQFTVADMEARVHAARLAWYDAAARLVAGQPVKKESAIAKLTASNAAMDNARAATQVFGGYGFMNESPVGRFYRDAKVLEIGEGTSEVQRMLIARELGLG